MRPCELQVLVPVPDYTAKCTILVTTGKAKYDATKKAIVSRSRKGGSCIARGKCAAAESCLHINAGCSTGMYTHNPVLSVPVGVFGAVMLVPARFQVHHCMRRPARNSSAAEHNAADA
jgi:hypothetical protein